MIISIRKNGALLCLVVQPDISSTPQQLPTSAPNYPATQIGALPPHYAYFINKPQPAESNLFKLLLQCALPPGGYSNFFGIRRLGPSIYRSPQKYISNFKHPQKIFEILATQKYIPILYFDLKKTLNCIEMTLKLAEFCDDPKKCPQNLNSPKKYSFF